MGQRYGYRPSEFIGIEDPWAAYQLDLLAMMSSLPDESFAIPPHSNASRENGPNSSRFGSLAGGIGGVRPRRMKVPENGIW